tara:strand:- start:759 stop:989 length:231 start_codon:yes stop_codon:yes gene_type:complete
MELSKTNPNWTRPADWKWEEDWGSPAWEARMDLLLASIAAKNEKYGFIVCPECETVHIRKTVSCRECEFHVDIPEE